MKQETKFQQVNKKIINSLICELNKQSETKFYKTGKEFFIHLKEVQENVIIDSGIKRDKKRIMNATNFMFQLGEAMYHFSDKLKYKNIDHLAKEIADYIYHTIVLTGIHNCPDVHWFSVEKLIKKIGENDFN